MFKIAGNGPAQVKLTPDYVPDMRSPPPFAGGKLIWHVVREAQEHGHISPLLAPDIMPMFGAALNGAEPITPLKESQNDSSAIPTASNPAAVTSDGSAAGGVPFAIVEKISDLRFSDETYALSDVLFSVEAPERASVSAINALTFDANDNGGGAIVHFAAVDSGLNLVASEFILI